MTVNNLTMLSSIVNGTPSGNYDGSSQAFDSDAVKAVNYYQGQGSLQVIGIRVTDFIGVITIQGSLDSTPVGWSDAYTYDRMDSSTTTDYHPVDLVGNFAWIRAAVTEFQAGTIHFVTIGY